MYYVGIYVRGVGAVGDDPRILQVIFLQLSTFIVLRVEKIEDI